MVLVSVEIFGLQYLPRTEGLLKCEVKVFWCQFAFVCAHPNVTYLNMHMEANQVYY